MLSPPPSLVLYTGQCTLVIPSPWSYSIHSVILSPQVLQTRFKLVFTLLEREARARDLLADCAGKGGGFMGPSSDVRSKSLQQGSFVTHRTPLLSSGVASPLFHGFRPAASNVGEITENTR